MFKKYHMEVCFWIMAICSVSDSIINLLGKLS